MNMTFVAVGPHCYGEGATKTTAVNRCRKARPSFYSRPESEMPYNLYRVSGDWEVDGHGTITATTVQKLEEHRPQ